MLFSIINIIIFLYSFVNVTVTLNRCALHSRNVIALHITTWCKLLDIQ